MLGFLPALAFLFLWLATLGRREWLSRHLGAVDAIVAFVVASVGMGLWIVIGTEVMSLLGALRFWPVVGFWSVTTAALAAFAARSRSGLSGVFVRTPKDGWLTRGLAGLTALLFLAVLLSAVLSAPSNFDSMAYHLVRQLFWMQQGSVDFYPTNSIRQLFMPPFSEFVQLHHMILAGSDRFANLVQTFALFGSMLGAVHLARVLGAGRLGQMFAAFLVVSNPMAFMEGSSTKNDLVVCFFVVATAMFGVRVVELRRASWTLLGLIGASLGLLLLTKGTAVVFALPVCALAGLFILRFGVGPLHAAGDTQRPPLWVLLRKPRHLVTVAVAGAFIGLMAAAPNVGHFYRNHKMFGHLNGPVEPEIEGSALYVNAHMASWETIVSNALRSATLHMSLPSDQWNEAVLKASVSLHERLGLDPNRDDTTWKGMPYLVPYYPGSEDRAGAAVHFLLALIVPLVAPFLRDKRDDAHRRALVLAWSFVPWLGFIAFCAVFRWQPWHTRLHVPIFVLLAPLAGWAFDRPWFGPKLAGSGAPLAPPGPGATEPPTPAPPPRLRALGQQSLVLMTTALAFLWLWPTFSNTGRPLWGRRPIWTTPRDDQRFNWRPQWEAGNDQMVAIVKQMRPKALGFRFGHNDLQYPMPRMIRDALPDIELVNVNPKVVTNPDGLTPTPELVVMVGPYQVERMENGRRYLGIAYTDPYMLFARDDLWAEAPKSLDRHRFLGWSDMVGLRKPREGERFGRLDTPQLTTTPLAAGKATLVLEASRPRGNITVRVNGVDAGAVPLGKSRTSLPVTLRAGKNRFEFVGVRGVTFTTIRLEPAL
jgi:hypothetical protein